MYTTQQATRRRRPQSRYGVQLQEKQDLKQLFGVREEQLRKYYEEARQSHHETGPALVILLEMRLDNAVYRAGFALTRAQARQMTTHRMFTVNGRAVDIPSLRVNVGNVVAVKENKQSRSYFTNFDKRMQNVEVPSWIKVSPKEYSFEIIGEPTYEEANVGVDIRAVVEYFAR